MVTKPNLTRDTEQRIPMSDEEYLAELPENIHAEWADGAAIILMPPNPRHQDVADFLTLLIRLLRRVTPFKLCLLRPH